MVVVQYTVVVILYSYNCQFVCYSWTKLCWPNVSIGWRYWDSLNNVLITFVSKGTFFITTLSVLSQHQQRLTFCTNVAKCTLFTKTLLRLVQGGFKSGWTFVNPDGPKDKMTLGQHWVQTADIGLTMARFQFATCAWFQCDVLFYNDNY